MDEAGVRAVLLVRAFEEEDREGHWIDLRERVAATRAARDEGAQGEALLATRARRLRARLESVLPAATRLAALSGRARLPGWLAFAGAAALGFAVDRIGPSKRIDVLSFPLLGVFAWNLGVYVLLAASGLAGLVAQRSASARGPGLLAGGLAWLASPERRWNRLRGLRDGGLAARCLQRYLRDWLRVGGPLHAARARRSLHLGAVGLVLGAVGGMYLRGLALEYRAGWESTFLEAQGVHRLLSACLAPGAWLTGLAVPDAAALAALRAEPEGGPAAVWIHLYAATALVLVVLPRLLLAALDRRRVRRLRRRLPVDWEADPYALRILAAERGRGVRVDLLAYSYSLAPRALEGLQALLLDLLGNRTSLEPERALEYGAPCPAIEARADETGRCTVLVFSLAQTPEQEVHGDFLEELKARVRPAGALLVVVDEGPYRARLGTDEPAQRRLDERRATWSRLLREVGLSALFAALDGAAEPRRLEEARAAMWPEPLREAG